MIRSAAAGNVEAKNGFARRYMPIVRAFLAARWAGTPLASELDDAVQDVFVDCFREGGLLERADPERGSGFRAFFLGAVRTAARHVETRRARRFELQGASSFHPERIAADEESLSRVFDRAWAQAVMREAAELQAARAKGKGEKELQRVELLRLRFQEQMPIREIAGLWGADPGVLHKEYSRAREEFAEALREVVQEHQQCPPGQLNEECRRLLDLLR